MPKRPKPEDEDENRARKYNTRSRASTSTGGSLMTSQAKGMESSLPTASSSKEGSRRVMPQRECNKKRSSFKGLKIAKRKPKKGFSFKLYKVNKVNKGNKDIKASELLKKPVDLNKIWNYLKYAIDNLLSREELTRAQYMEMYSLMYNYCASVIPQSNDGENKVTGAQVTGMELYLHVENHQRRSISSLAKMGERYKGDKLLAFFSYWWESFQYSAKILDGLCSYLNRNWVRRQQEEGNNDILNVYDMSMILWRDIFFRKHRVRVAKALIQRLLRERQGNDTNLPLMKNIISCYIRMGNSADCDPEEEDLLIYQKYLETPFLKSIEKCYTLESYELILHNTVTDYMQMAQVYYTNEYRRAKLIFHDSTVEKLGVALEIIFIAKHREILVPAFLKLLQQDDIDTLKRIFFMVLYTRTMHNGIVALFKKHVIRYTCTALQETVLEGFNCPKLYVTTILDTFKKFTDLVKTAFFNDVRFSVALDHAIKKCINDNPIAPMVSSSPSKSPELLARYCDIVLKKSFKYPAAPDLEDILDNIIMLFNYLGDKSAFEKFHYKLLAKRLVQGSSVSDDAEALMFAKLKENCGYKYIFMLERLFKDIVASKNLNNRFKTYFETTKCNDALDCNVNVVPSAYWPLELAPHVALPSILERPLVQFEMFYNSQYKGRKLHWIHYMSRGELVSNCFKERYVLRCNGYQLAILLQYNSRKVWSVLQLQELTEMSNAVSIRILQGLIKQNLLESADGENLNQNSVVTLNEDYQNTQPTVNINVPLTPIAKTQEEAIEQFVEEDRILYLQAAIVRVMKMRKEMTHTELMSEMLNIISHKFVPSIQEIKNCISILIDKEYIKKHVDKRNSYLYIA